MKILLLLLFISSIAFCRYEENNPIDLSVKLGLTVGTVTVNSPTEIPYDFGGAPIVATWNKELSPKFGMDVSLHLVTDFTNSVISRTGLEVGGVVHLLGGERRLIDENDKIRILSGYTHNLSLALHTGFHTYNASNQTGTESLKGSVLQTSAGLQYRIDLSKDYALGFEGNYGLFTIPMGTERLSTSVMDFLVSLRFYL